MKSLDERKRETEKLVEEFFNKSKAIMLEKNDQRGDAWRGSGLLGQFIEIHSMYFRLRTLLWDSEPDINNSKWIDQVANALEDMRNFTILAELCLMEKNVKGNQYVEQNL